MLEFILGNMLLILGCLLSLGEAGDCLLSPGVGTMIVGYSTGGGGVGVTVTGSVLAAGRGEAGGKGQGGGPVPTEDGERGGQSSSPGSVIVATDILTSVALVGGGDTDGVAVAVGGSGGFGGGLEAAVLRIGGGGRAGAGAGGGVGARAAATV